MINWWSNLFTPNRPVRRQSTVLRRLKPCRHVPQLESLESRIAPAGLAGLMQTTYEIYSGGSGTGGMGNNGGINPFGGAMTPTSIRAAYGFSQVSFGATAANGAGETIAIVDAYNQPNIASNLATFDSTYGVAAPPSFKVVNQSGGSTLPANNSG